MPRFANEDPLREDGGINLYAYVDNRPVVAVDPLGLKPSEAPGGSTGAGGSGHGGRGPSGGGSGGSPTPPQPPCLPPTCIGVFFSCLADWVVPGPSTVGEALVSGGATVHGTMLYNEALRHATVRGLRYPQKSSIWRGYMARAGSSFRFASGVVPLVFANIGIWKCVGRELHEGLNGGCRP